MRQYLGFGAGCIFLVPNMFFLTSVLPSYADFPTEQLAQGDPNRDRLVQPGTIPPPLSPDTQQLQQPSPTSPTPTVDIGSVEVKKIEVEGSTIFTKKQLEPKYQSIIGTKATVEQLKDVANRITQLYFDKGYINSIAYLPEQPIINGIVKIQVVEGGIEEIKIEGTKQLKSNYVRSRVALGITKPFSLSILEDQLKLLKADPLISNIEATLKDGKKPGQSILVVRVTEAKSFDLSVGVDNYSPVSVGSERLGVNTSYGNLTGLGDQLAFSYYHSLEGGSNIYDFSYKVPLNPMNGTLMVRSELNDNRIIQNPFDTFDIHGNSQLYEISYRQPLVRSLREEFALSLGFTAQDGQTFTFAGPTPFGFGPDQNGNSQTRVLKFGQDYLRRDTQGTWSIHSLFNFGLNIFDATNNPDPIPDGQFFSWFGEVQRVQKLSNNNLLYVQTDIQLTPDALLPSQQFIIGGGQSVRGYRQNARAGDNGVRFTLEDRFTVEKDNNGDPSLQFAPFFDSGYIWNVDSDPNTLQRQKFLAGLGLGLLWQPMVGLNVRLDYALPLINLDDWGNNAQDDGFYFSVAWHLK